MLVEAERTCEQDIECIACNVGINDIIEKDGFFTCTKCGLTLYPRISDSAEWGNYSDSAGNPTSSSRCGTTSVSETNPYSNSYSFMPPGVKNICYKNGVQVKYDITSVHVRNCANHKTKSFSVVEDTIDEMSDKYSPRILSTAKMLWSEITRFEKVSEDGNTKKKITRAGVRKGLIACCVYYACINFNSTRSPSEVCADFGLCTRQFNKGNREFKEIFETSPRWGHLLRKTSGSDDYFNRFCSDLEMNGVIGESSAFELALECKDIYEKIKENLHGLFPKSAACGIIFCVLRRRGILVTKTSVSRILGICGPSLTKCCLAVADLVP